LRFFRPLSIAGRALEIKHFGSRRSFAPGEDPYAAPELRGDRAFTDPAIDVYSSAAVVHFLRAGHDPLPGQPWAWTRMRVMA
jgi:hypothetical protein